LLSPNPDPPRIRAKNPKMSESMESLPIRRHPSMPILVAAPINPGQSGEILAGDTICAG
jgi:hypothetical protein